jgi:predicted ATPase
VKPVIRSLTLKGFRSFDSARIEFDNPTFLVGQNGAGKSNLVDALAFIGEAMTSPLRSVMARRGGISALYHRSPTSNGLPHFGLALELENPSEEISSAQYGFEIQTLPQRGFQVKREQCVITGSAGRVYFERSEDPEGSSSSSSFRNLIPVTDSSSLVLPLVGGHKTFAPVVHALSAMRAYAIEPGRLRSLQDPDGTTNLRSDGSNSAAVLQAIINESPDDAALINDFLANVLPYRAEVHPKEVGDKLSLEFLGDLGGQKSLQLGAFSMSDGTLRTLGLLLAVFQNPTPSLIVLEEPELTIHPGALGTILDLIKIASHRTQVVITTHSPELLDASNWIEGRHLRIIYWDDGASHVARIGKASREALTEHLMGAGELLRSNVLDTPPLHRQSPEYSLFEARA